MSEETKVVEKENEKLTPEQAIKIEKDFLEEGEPIVFYDRAKREKLTFIIPPLTLKDAKAFMKLLKTIDIDFVILNFAADGEEGEDQKDRSSELYEALMLAFKYNYPEMTPDRLEEICDINKAKELISIMLGINGLKK